MARRLIKLAAAVALLLDGGEDVLTRTEANGPGADAGSVRHGRGAGPAHRALRRY